MDKVRMTRLGIRLRTPAIAALASLSACAHNIPRNDGGTQLCSIRSGESVAVSTGYEPSGPEPVVTIELADSDAEMRANQTWLVRTERFEFKGEMYFAGPDGLQPGQIPDRASRATLVHIGQHDGVALYTWAQWAHHMPWILFVRGGEACNLWQYWHVSTVRN